MRLQKSPTEQHATERLNFWVAIRFVPQDHRKCIFPAENFVFFTTQAVEWVYLASAGGLGAILIYLAWKLWRDEGSTSARGVYLYSLLYLAGLFVAIMVDSTVSL